MTRDMLLDFINNKDLDKYNWYLEMFSIPRGEKFEYYSINGNTVEFHNGYTVKLDKDRETPLVLSDTVRLLKGDLDIVEVDSDYSLGDIILNYLLISRPLGKSIPFTRKLHYDKVEDYISNYLGDTVTVDQYMKYAEGCDFLQQMSELFVVPATEKSLFPAPGIKEYKDKLFKEYREKYGDQLDSDIRLIVEIEEKLVAYDREYLKDDPTYNIVSNNKIIGNSRKNLYGSIGAEIGMDGRITPIVQNSLLEGYPKNNEQLASLYNSNRKGSIMRGHMTQFTGADAKMTSRVLNTVTVIRSDCGTKDTYQVDITEDNKSEYVNYYIMVSGKPVLLNPGNIDSYVGKTISLRTYLTCKEKDGKYCSTCAGRQGEDNNKIAIVLSTENNAIFTNTSMKAMHDKTLKLVDYDLHTALY